MRDEQLSDEELWDKYHGPDAEKAALHPVRSEPLLDVAKRLRDAWSMMDNALDGLAMRGEKDSPLVRDLREAQAEVETSRQAIYAHTSNIAISLTDRKET